MNLTELIEYHQKQLLDAEHWENYHKTKNQHGRKYHDEQFIKHNTRADFHRGAVELLTGLQ
jgi:hypothetical protein